MLVNVGKVRALQQQLSWAASLVWFLFTSNTTVGDSTVFSSLTEAAWTGYSRITAGTWNTPTIVSNAALSVPVTAPVFGNTSGSSQNFYGWGLLDTSDNTLVAATNIGLTSISNGGSYPLVPSLTDNHP